MNLVAGRNCHRPLVSRMLCSLSKKTIPTTSKGDTRLNPSTLFSTIGTAVLVATLTFVPMAQADEVAELEAKFTASDTNSDGKLTKEEAKEGGMRRIVRGFDKIDSEGNGYVTLDQIKTMMNSR